MKSKTTRSFQRNDCENVLRTSNDGTKASFPQKLFCLNNVWLNESKQRYLVYWSILFAGSELSLPVADVWVFRLQSLNVPATTKGTMSNKLVKILNQTGNELSVRTCLSHTSVCSKTSVSSCEVQVKIPPHPNRTNPFCFLGIDLSRVYSCCKFCEHEEIVGEEEG